MTTPTTLGPLSTPVRVEYRGGPRNTEIVTFGSWDDVLAADGEAHEYVDSNLGDPRGPRIRMGHYVLDGPNFVLGWTINHEAGSAGGPFADPKHNEPDGDDGSGDQIRPRVSRRS